MRTRTSVATRKRHKKVLKQTKGMQRQRRSSYRLAKQALLKSQSYAYRDRRARKRDFRKLWIARINAGAREEGLSYSKLTSQLTKAGVKLDRKILAELAVNQPVVFKSIVKTVKQVKNRA